MGEDLYRLQLSLLLRVYIDCIWLGSTDMILSWLCGLLLIITIARIITVAIIVTWLLREEGNILGRSIWALSNLSCTVGRNWRSCINVLDLFGRRRWKQRRGIWVAIIAVVVVVIIICITR